MIVPDATPKRKRTTLRDVADLTGLSPAGVSYALRGQRVSAATAERVRDAADRLGFRSDPIARALRSGSSGVIGVIGGSLADYWHQEFASELQRHLRRRGRYMLLADADGDAGTEIERARGLVDQRVDGLIALPVAPGSPAWSEIVAEVPVVAVGAPLPAPAGAVRFQADEGSDLVLDHLRGLGHERIAVLASGMHRPRRRRGVHTRVCGFAAADGRAAAVSELRRATPPTALFALSDALAYGAYMACADLGLARARRRVGGRVRRPSHLAAGQPRAHHRELGHRAGGGGGRGDAARRDRGPPPAGARAGHAPDAGAPAPRRPHAGGVRPLLVRPMRT